MFNFLKKLIPSRSIKDNPESDATDFAHPAWWRGNDAGVKSTVRVLTAILESKKKTGVFGYAPLDTLANEIAKLAQRYDVAMEVIKNTCDDMVCLPECDRYGHSDLCPVANPAAAWQNLRDRLAAVAVCEDHRDLMEIRQGLANGCYVCEALERNNGEGEAMVKFTDALLTLVAVKTHLYKAFDETNPALKEAKLRDILNNVEAFIWKK